jgi:hypothetical protein
MVVQQDIYHGFPEGIFDREMERSWMDDGIGGLRKKKIARGHKFRSLCSCLLKDLAHKNLEHISSSYILYNACCNYYSWLHS